MIDPKAVVTYSQYNEDLILRALLNDVKSGFYVDVGANYPTIDSVTKSFYEQGWSGINIEPIKSLHTQLQKERPRDSNLQCGAGDTNGKATLREYVDLSGHSTFDGAQKGAHDEKLKYVDYDVPVKRLDDIFNEHKVKKIHFIKIDVEGYEYQVVLGNDWVKYRPEIICIEANHVSKDWRPILIKNNYKQFITDGLNEYYVADEAWGRTEGFAEKIVSLDFHALKQHQYEGWTSDSQELEKLHGIINQKEQLIQSQSEQLKELAKYKRLSFVDRTMLGRLKITAYGLTIDLIRYLKTK